MIQLFHSFSTAFPQLFYKTRIKPISNRTAFPQLFHSFSTAFPQLFYSLLTTCSNLLITCSNLQTTCSNLLTTWIYIVKTKDNPRSLHVHDMSLSHFVQWRRLLADGGGFRRGKSMGCSSNTAQPLTICQIVPRDKPTRQTAIESERKGFFLTLHTITVFELQPMEKHALNPPPSSASLLH